MKRSRRSSSAANKVPPAKKASKESSSTGKDDPANLGVSEAQLGWIVDQVGQRLAKFVAAEVAAVLSVEKARTPPKASPGATARQGDDTAFLVLPAPKIVVIGLKR